MVNNPKSTDNTPLKHFVLSVKEKKLIHCEAPTDHRMIISSPSQARVKKYTEILPYINCKSQSISKIPKNKYYEWLIKHPSTYYGIKLIGMITKNAVDENNDNFVIIEVFDKRRENTGITCKIFTEPGNILFADFKKF